MRLTRRQKYYLLRWIEETIGGAAVGFFLVMCFLGTMIGPCPAFVAAIIATAVCYIISFESGCAARRMRRRRRK